MKIFVPAAVQAVCDKLIERGFSPFVVGGAVRDAVMNRESKDLDVEVFGCSIEQLKSVLDEFGRVDEVGASFGILKLTVDGETFDFSVPRRDNKIGKGHRGFKADLDLFISHVEAAIRRDFTINAMMFDMKSGKILDHFDGLHDLQRGILRPVSSAFVQDAIRIFRGMQFAARFGFVIEDEKGFFVEAASGFSALTKDGLRIEFEKLFLAPHPDMGFRALKDVRVLWLMPEVLGLIGTPQHPVWHPEGDVFEHTMLVLNEMARICDREGISGRRRMVLVAAALCHDFGKPSTTVLSDKLNWTAPGHAEAGEAPTRAFLSRMGFSEDFIDEVVKLVLFHMHDKNFSSCDLDKARRRFVRRLANKVNIEDLALVAEADHSGRHPLPKGMPKEMAEIVSLWSEMKEVGDVPSPILMGRHLIEMGFKPGKIFSEILGKVFEAQLDGEVSDLESAKAFAKEVAGG